MTWYIRSITRLILSIICQTYATWITSVCIPYIFYSRSRKEVPRHNLLFTFRITEERTVYDPKLKTNVITLRLHIVVHFVRKFRNIVGSIRCVAIFYFWFGSIRSSFMGFSIARLDFRFFTDSISSTAAWILSGLYKREQNYWIRRRVE